LLPNERDSKGNVKHFVCNDFAENESVIADRTHNQSWNLYKMEEKKKKKRLKTLGSIRAAKFKTDEWIIACRLTVKLLTCD